MNKENIEIIEAHTEVLKMADEIVKKVYDEKDTENMNKLGLVATVYSNIISQINRKGTLTQQKQLTEMTKNALAGVIGR